MVDLNCVMTREGRAGGAPGYRRGRAFTIEEQRVLVDLCAKGFGSFWPSRRRFWKEAPL